MIDTSSVYNIELELAKLPDEQDRVGKLRAEAIKKVADLQMSLDIFIAEEVAEICLKEEINTASGRTEVRKTRVLLNPFYKKTRRKLINATEAENILTSNYFNLNNRCSVLRELYQNARRQMGDYGVVEYDSKERVDTKLNRAGDVVDY